MSHTAKIKVEYTNEQALRSAVESLGGQWLGEGRHKLYGSNAETGLGFKLPHWAYPVVLTPAGQLAHDTYGNDTYDYNTNKYIKAVPLSALAQPYAVALAEQSAQALGWLTERTATGGLIVHHPSGGSITVAGGTVDANNFQGVGCHEAVLALGLPTEDIQNKPEFAAVQAQANIAASN